MSKTVLVLGSGQIGVPVAKLLLSAGYKVHQADISESMDVLLGNHICHPSVDLTDKSTLVNLANGIEDLRAIVSCLPYFCNKTVADVAHELDLHYFDLTEDVETTEYIRELAEGSDKAFIPQCGLAPGYVSLVAQNLMDQFDEVDTVNMRVGALPTNPNNALKYNLTWSTNGLINECGNPCKAIENGELVKLIPLEGYERIILDGVEYEAFNTSGGIGTLADKCVGKVKTMNYRTMRYPGHRDLFKFLMFDMGMNEDRENFEMILDRQLPKTNEDVVLVYVSVKGTIDGQFSERNMLTKNYGHDLNADDRLTAIQATTAAGICAVVDIVLSEPTKYNGFVEVEQISLGKFGLNRFGAIYG